MRHVITTLVLAFVPAFASAQHHDTSTRTAAAGEATAPCPLHLTTLDLTPTQDSALRAIRTAHMAEMNAVRARLGVPAMKHDTSHVGMKHDSKRPAEHHAAMTPETTKALQEAMQASMARSLDAVRATLSVEQRTLLELAVKAHATARDARSPAGTTHGCGCCG